MAEMVPSGATVIDIGSGPEGVRRWLDPSNACVALDLVPRGPESIVCDLNRRPFPDLTPYRPSVAVLGGVLEYVKDVPAVVAWLAGHVTTCIASYECASGNPGWRERVRRTRLGWLNSFSEEALRMVFDDRGFELTRTASWDGGDGPGRVFVFTRCGREDREGC
jgi:hypothetical protein